MNKCMMFSNGILENPSRTWSTPIDNRTPVEHTVKHDKLTLSKLKRAVTAFLRAEGEGLIPMEDWNWVTLANGNMHLRLHRQGAFGSIKVTYLDGRGRCNITATTPENYRPRHPDATFWQVAALIYWIEQVCAGVSVRKVKPHKEFLREQEVEAEKSSDEQE